MNDEAGLLKAAKKLDQDALITIFDKYAPAIYKYVFRCCSDPIESDHLVGDVFTKLLEHFAAGKGPIANLRAYVYQIAYSLIVCRPHQDQRFVTLGVVTESPALVITKPIGTQANEQAALDVLLSMLNHKLSDIERHVIILRFLEDFSLGETAVIVGKNINNVKVIQNRGIAKLRERFEK